jgi:hypothetical protein
VSKSDEFLVDDFMNTWASDACGKKSEQMRKHLHEMLVAARDVADDPFGAVMGRAEARIREVLARLGPPGTEVTPAVISAAQREIATIIKDELTKSGMGEQMATGLAAVLAAAMRVKQKD